MMNEIGNRKLETKSTICASSLGGSLGPDGCGGGGAAAATAAGTGAGADVARTMLDATPPLATIGGDGATGGVDCCDMPDMETAESTCNELLLCGVFLIELE